MYYLSILLIVLANAGAAASPRGCEAELSNLRKNFLAALSRGQRPPEDMHNFFVDPKPFFIAGYFGQWKADLEHRLKIRPGTINGKFKHVREVREFLNANPKSEEGEVRLLIVRMPPTIYYFPVVGYEPRDGSITVLRTDADNWKLSTSFGTDPKVGWKIFPTDHAAAPARGQVLGMLRLKIPGLSL